MFTIASENFVDLFSKYLPESVRKGYAQYRPLCVSNVTLTCHLHVLETQSMESSNRCVATNMGMKVPICLPALQSDFSSTKKTKNRKDQNDVYNS